MDILHNLLTVEKGSVKNVSFSNFRLFMTNFTCQTLKRWLYFFIDIFHFIFIIHTQNSKATVGINLKVKLKLFRLNAF